MATTTATKTTAAKGTETATKIAEEATAQVKANTEAALEQAAKVAEQATAQVQASAEKFNEQAAKVTEEFTAKFKETADKAIAEYAAKSDETLKALEQGNKRFEENTQRAKEFGSNLAGTAKSNSLSLVDNYENAAKSVFGFQRQFADAAQNDMVKQAASMQIKFAEDVTAAWVKAARALLK